MLSPLIYALHSGNLYGTERMALATLDSLRHEYHPVLFAPHGPLIEKARQMEITVHPYSYLFEFTWKIRKYFAEHKSLAIAATGVKHSLVSLKWNRIYRRRLAHLHIVHGGADELSSYGRKRKLNGANVVFVAVSAYVKERLVANGVSAEQIAVIENFLSDDWVRATPKRSTFDRGGIERVIVISRLDPMKRVDVLLDALEHSETLKRIPIRVFGSGWDIDALRKCAAGRNQNVDFAGFQNDITGELAASDLLVHTCPEEPFGLAIIEAMAANIPVLVPDRGGAAALVEDNVSGFHFAANQAESLASRLLELMDAPADLLNRVVAGGRRSLAFRFSQSARIAEYSTLLNGGRL
jgi:glycosyltransferase involved in cell wall biosynthesis